MQITHRQITFQLLLNKLILIITFCACSMPMHFLHAQNATLTGRVLSSDNSETLEDANVYVKNYNIGSATDVNGEFSIKDLPLGNLELEISILGYRDTTISILIDNSLVKLRKILIDPEVLHFEEIKVEVHSDLDPTSSLSSFSISGKKCRKV